MQIRRVFRWGVIPFAVSGLLLAGCASNTAGGEAVTFGDTSVSVAEFQRELTVLKDNRFLGPTVLGEDGELSPEAVAAQAQAVLVDLIIAQRFADAGLTLAPDAREQAEAKVRADYDQQSDGQGAAIVASFPEWYRNKLIETTATATAVVNSFITEDEAAYYARNKATFDAQCPTGAMLRYIPAQSPADATRLQGQLNAGASYVTVLRAAVGPTADPASFDAGCYRAGDLSDPAANASLVALAPGQRTVVQLQGSFLVVEAQPVNAQTLAPSIARAQRSEAQQQLSVFLQEQVLARRPQFDPRFAVLTYEPGEDGTTVINVLPAGQGGAPRIREMPPVSTTAPGPFDELLPVR